MASARHDAVAGEIAGLAEFEGDIERTGHLTSAPNS